MASVHGADGNEPTARTVMPTSNLDAAVAYTRRGWHIVPILPGQKRPAWNNWTEKATRDPHLARQWWTVHPTHGIGIATGPHTGIWVLDIDTKEGANGEETLTDLQQEHGTLPDTLEVLTGSGGRHLYWQWPDIDIRNTQMSAVLGVGLDVRGDGGQVVAPPTFHPNGTRYEWEVSNEHLTPQPAPGWLIDLVTRPPKPVRQTSATRVDDPILGDRPGDQMMATTSWPELLEADGAVHLMTAPDGHELWSRPPMPDETGFQAHTSASLYYKGSDVLKVFTPNWKGDGWALEADETYTKFGYYTARHHNGDFTAAARALTPAVTTSAAVTENDLDAIVGVVGHDAAQTLSPAGQAALATRTNWSTFWEADHQTEDWLVPNLVARGRNHALYAGAKVGKSLVVLSAVAQAATGRPIFGQTPVEPFNILYLDYEMTAADLAERLETFGYGPDDDLEKLHYLQLPPLAELDEQPQGRALLEVAIAVDAQLVVIDTASRAVNGEENSADTYRNLYNRTLRNLKSAGIAVLRIDHAGKEAGKGQRGSSAKNDDVDVVYKLTRIQGGYELTAPLKRLGWIKSRIELKGDPDNPEFDGFTITAKTAADSYPDGTKALAERLDELGVDPAASRRTAADSLRTAGLKVRNDRVLAAQKWRRAEIAKFGMETAEIGVGDHSGDHKNQMARGPAGTTPPETCRDQAKQPSGTTGDQWAEGVGTRGPPVGGTLDPPDTKPDPTEIEPVRWEGL